MKTLKILLFPIFILSRIGKAPFWFITIQNFKSWDSYLVDILFVGFLACLIFAPWYWTLAFFVLLCFWFLVIVLPHAAKELEKLEEELER